MCCIFTCCGWMIDLIQRLWTFTMSCCVSSAVCCAFVTASVSGIALGYNYSLAEYIDLKETNVSVYIKRGVFDDEIVDDMDWRRSGHMPVAGHLRSDNLMTGAPSEDSSPPEKSGRRLDDSIFESDVQNKFEGSLMRLAAKAPASTTIPPVTSDLEMSEIMSKYQLGSIDQLKAIQSLINMRKSGNARDSTAKGPVRTYGYDERYLPHFPAFPDPMMSGRRIMPQNVNINVDKADGSLRKAVPPPSIVEPAKWALPKLNRQDLPGGIVAYDYLDRSPTYPPPVTPKAGPVKPLLLRAPSPIVRPTLTPKKEESSRKIEYAVPKEVDRDIEEFKEKLLLDRFDNPNLQKSDVLKMPKEDFMKAEDDYEADIKGLPVRKKRDLDNHTSEYIEEKINDKEKLDQPTTTTIKRIFELAAADTVKDTTIKHDEVAKVDENLLEKLKIHTYTRSQESRKDEVTLKDKQISVNDDIVVNVKSGVFGNLFKTTIS